MVTGALPAQAGRELICFGDGTTASFVYDDRVVDVKVIQVGGQTWASPSQAGYTEAARIHVMKTAADTDTTISADFSGSDGGPVIATLRTVKLQHHDAGTTPDNRVSGGLFWMKGTGEWVVTCSLL